MISNRKIFDGCSGEKIFYEQIQEQGQHTPRYSKEMQALFGTGLGGTISSTGAPVFLDNARIKA